MDAGARETRALMHWVAGVAGQEAPTPATMHVVRVVQLMQRLSHWATRLQQVSGVAGPYTPQRDMALDVHALIACGRREDVVDDEPCEHIRHVIGHAVAKKPGDAGLTAAAIRLRRGEVERMATYLYENWPSAPAALRAELALLSGRPQNGTLLDMNLHDAPDPRTCTHSEVAQWLRTVRHVPEADVHAKRTFAGRVSCLKPDSVTHMHRLLASVAETHGRFAAGVVERAMHSASCAADPTSDVPLDVAELQEAIHAAHAYDEVVDATDDAVAKTRR